MGETVFKPAGQQRLWVDADALLSLVSRAMRAQSQGQNPLPLLEQAYALARGEFLEDALCRLMLLLVEQQRRQEAQQLYQYTRDVLRGEQAEPADYAREPARRIRQGLILRERGGRYTAAQAHIPFLVGQHRLSTEQGNRSDVEWARPLSVAAPSMSQTASFVESRDICNIFPTKLALCKGRRYHKREHGGKEKPAI